MVNEDDKKPVEKPVPLPRKSLHKQNKIAPLKENETEDDSVLQQKNTESRNFIRDDWKSASGSFVFEKSRQMKNEVQKLEKSVKSIIARRKSIQAKSSKVPIHEHRSESLPDDSVFLNISFNSPLTDDEKQSDTQSVNLSEDINFYENEMSPPSYPPPDLPDESVYDKMRSFNLFDQQSCKSTSSDSTSNYDEFSSQGLSLNFLEQCKIDFMKKETFERYSPQFSNEENEENDDRYEIIHENSVSNEYDCFRALPNIPESEVLNMYSIKDVNVSKERDIQASNIKYIIHLFDPLEQNNTEDIKIDLGIKNSIEMESHKILKSSVDENILKRNYEKESLFKLDVIPSSSEIVSTDLKEGHYGKIRKATSSENEYAKLKSDCENKPSIEPPPIPPRKMERLVFEFEDKNLTPTLKEISEKCETTVVGEKLKPSEILQWSSLKRVAKVVADNIESRASYISLPRKKSIKVTSEEKSNQNSFEQKSCVSESCSLPKNFPKHNGIVYRSGNIQRWGVLSQRKLTLFAHKDSPDVKETVPMDGVLSVQVTQNRVNMDNVGVYCFEISISSKSQPLLFGVPSISERHIWMRKLLESIGPSFPAKLSMDYTKAGWCYAKESISCSWNKCCILLHNRTLHLSSELGCLITADLRKARNITYQTEGFPCEKVTEKGPLLLLDLQEKTLYLQMDYERETKAWEAAITAAALKNGPNLCDHQLTKDNIPTVVDKCLNFVHTHGSFSEGIYRRNGSNRTVSQLLASFRCNAWCVNLHKEDCSEFDVSSVLKRYFRDLPEPLLLSEIHEDFEAILEVNDFKEKIEMYKSTLKKLPDINYLTAKRLMGHLYFINKQKDKNLMGAENLAAIWGPTLLQVQEQVSLNSNCFKFEALVINDLITYYPEIFDVKQFEVEREMKILEMLESYHNNSNTLNKKPSGELKIWVYLYSAKNVDSCINVSINPHKTAEEVCKELSYKTNDPYHLLCLEEVVCNGNVSRPLNHSEKVLETVLRWSYWDETDRKDNCLVLTKNDLFREVAQSAKFPVIICEELKFADQKSKSFKTYQFEFSQAKLSCFKDKSCTQKIAEWKIEDIIWYLGHEPKRVPNARWSITFIEKECIGPRSKDRPFFGNTICGTSEEQKFKLISAMLMAQYAKDILPTPNLME